MNYREIGDTGITCSEVGLGTWAFASQIYGKVSEQEAYRTISMALEAGITVFDTAPLYGNKEEDGISERILGKGLGGKRKDVLISTKFGRYATDDAAPNFHAQRARESVEGSLKRLNTDVIDILFFHSPFGASDIHDDVWEELGKLKDEGKIRLLGHSISMFKDTEGMCRNWAKERKIQVAQVVYSLMNREATALINDLNALGVGIFARESLANGFLSGTITKDTEFPSGTLNARYAREEIEARVNYVDELSFLLDEVVTTMPQAAVRWVLNNPKVSLVLSGAKNEQELSDWIKGATTKPFSSSQMAQAEEVHTKDFQAA